jgi:hypothetical protein
MINPFDQKALYEAHLRRRSQGSNFRKTKAHCRDRVSGVDRRRQAAHASYKGMREEHDGAAVYQIL